MKTLTCEISHVPVRPPHSGERSLFKAQLRWWVLGAACLTLQACIWSPGQHVKSSEFSDSGTSEDGRYQLVQITPQLIATDKAIANAVMIPPALMDYKPAEYRIGAGDSLYITVWEHPELTSPAGNQQQPAANGRLVREDGTLFYPYVGLLKAQGMTLEQLRDAITRKLAAYVEKPQVDVSVISYGSQQITLRGAFTDTMPQALTVIPLTLSQAIGRAKIDTTQANLSNLILTRDGEEYHLDLDTLSRTPHGLDRIWLKAGDEIYLSYADRQEVYMMGEVVRPQALPFKTAELTLTQALGKVGGLDPTTSKGKSVYVIRGVKNVEKTPAEIFQLDASSPTAFVLGSQFLVHPGDVVFVGAAGITRWNRYISQLLPSSSIITNAASSNSNFRNGGL